MRRLVACLPALLLTATSALAQPPAPPTPPGPPAAAPAAIEAVTFDEAVRRALDRNPSVGQAVQSILRAEALLQSARTVLFPTVNATLTTTVLNEERGFNGQVTQPQAQSAIGASVAYPVLAAARWAARTQAEDQVRVARVAADEARRQVALAVAQAYLVVIAQRRQVEVNLRALENARAHLDYASTRLRAGAGSRLNELRAAQEVATDEVLLEQARLAVRRAQEALGVLLVADAPVDAAAEPVFTVDDAAVTGEFLSRRIDVRLAAEQVRAAERVARDSWKDWVPTGTVAFQPQYVTPAGLFQPSNTWNAVFQLAIPIFDGGQRRANARLRETSAETARLELTDVELRARADRRIAEAAVASTAAALESARRAAAQAEEVVRITDVAFRAGATTNLEVIDAQRRARDAGTAAAQAEDRARQARLDLLVALGRFPQ
jgi:outer membrane protein TolC